MLTPRKFNGKLGIPLAISVVEAADERIKRISWTNEEIKEKFGRRSADKIIRSRNTFYMNPCLDLTLASAAWLRIIGKNPTLVIEEHGKTPEYPYNMLHFALEFSDTTGEYFINYRSGNTVEIGREQYPGRKDIPQLQLLRFTNPLNPALPLHANLGFNSLEEALENIFKGYELEPQIEKMMNENSRENYQRYKDKYGMPFQINNINSRL